MNPKFWPLTLFGLLLLCGCAGAVRRSEGKSALSISLKEASKFAEKLGYTNSYATVDRTGNGDRLFIQFKDHSGTYRVAIVSADGILVKELPGQSRLNDDAKPVFWLNEPAQTVQFATGYVLPTNTHTLNFISDGRFVAMFDSRRSWIADVESPMEELVDFTEKPMIRKIVSYGDTLHVFLKGQPERQPRPDGWAVLKRYEYKLSDGKAHLAKIQDFTFTWGVLEFDPETGLMIARSWDDMFPRAWLVNTKTEHRERFGFIRGYRFFLKDPVIQRFQQVMAD